MSAQSLLTLFATILGLIAVVVPAVVVVIYSVRKSMTEVLTNNATVLKQYGDAEKARADLKEKEYLELEARCKKDLTELEARLTTKNEELKTQCAAMQKELESLKETYHEIQEFTFSVQRKNEKLTEESAALKAENARLLAASLTGKRTDGGGDTIG